MDCPKCGEEMEMHVSVGLKLPSRYLMLLSKKVIARKECQITAAFWEEATVVCQKCWYRQKGL